MGGVLDIAIYILYLLRALKAQARHPMENTNIDMLIMQLSYNSVMPLLLISYIV